MRSFLVGLAGCLLLSPLARADASSAGVPLVLGHQGRLLDGQDAPVNGQVKLTFELHTTDNPSVVDPKWSESRQVQVSGGTYGVVLGDTRPGAGGTALPLDLLGLPELYLQVKVGDTVLLPRLRIPSVPYALRAGHAAATETVLANGVSTAALQDGAVTLAKLSLTNGKFTGLDADTLDGLDSSAFAPAAIVDTIGAPPVGSSLAKEIAVIRGDLEAGATSTALTALSGDVGTIKSVVGGSLATDVGAIKASVGGNVGADVVSIKSTLGTTAGDVAAIRTAVGALVGSDVTSIKSTVGTVASDVAALKTLTVRLPDFSQSCQDFAAKGWPSESSCLHDGRWHLYFTMDATGKHDVGGTATKPGFYAAAKAGAETKARFGREWYHLSVRSTDGADSFWVFVTDLPQMLSMVVNNTGIVSVQAQAASDGNLHYNFDDNWLAADFGNRHFAMHHYSDRGAANLASNGGAEFWATW